MEKYTIDIDKVLDEFEETEALKVHEEKTPEFVFDQPRTANGLTSPEAAFSSHPMNKNVLDSSICSANSSSDSDPSLKKDILQLSNDGISSNSYILECERKFICNNVISENLNKNDTLCIDSTTSKHLKYDIFYKPHESSSFNDKSTNHSLTDDHLSQDVEHQYSLCDSSPDEILCVSVQEDEIKTESQTNRSQNLVSENVINSKDLSKDSVLAAEISSQPKLFLVVNDPVLGSKDLELKCEPKCLEKLDVSSLSESKIVPGNSVPEDVSSVQIDHSKKDSSSEGTLNEISVKGEPNALNPSHEFLPHSSSDDLAFKAVLDLVPSNIEKQVSDSPNEPCNDYLKESVKCDNVYKIEGMMAQHINDEIDTQVNKGLEDKYIAGQDVENVDVHVDEVVNLGNFSIQDDDSGVSSTEDISGNSPIEISNSESNKSVPNENYDPKDKFSCIESCDNLAFHVDVSDQADTSAGLIIGLLILLA